MKVPASELATTEDETEEIVRLRAEIEATRMRIYDSIDHLRDEIEETVDWQRWVRENPWKTVGMAFAVGFLFGSG